jgi:PAS domain S-box-containing protein
MKTKTAFSWGHAAVLMVLTATTLPAQSLTSAPSNPLKVGALTGLVLALLAFAKRLRRPARKPEPELPPPMPPSKPPPSDGPPEKPQAEQISERELLCALLEHASDRIFFKDRFSCFLRCSRATAKRFGVTDREIVGKSDFNFFADSHAQPAFNDEQEIMRTGQPVTGKVEREVMKNGEELWALTAKWPLRNQKGEIIGTFGISKDITALKEAEAKLAQLHRQLVDASRVAGMAEVATTVLHNVGNVLNSVNVSASLMEEKLRNTKSSNLLKAAALIRDHASDLPGFFANDPKGRQLPAYLANVADHLASEQNDMRRELASLCANIEHIKEIVAMQQAYAKLSGVMELLPPATLVEDALRLNAGAVERHQIQIIREFSPVPPVLVDKHKVLQILVNLIRNAKYALDDRGHVDKRMTLRVAPGAPGTVEISIIDNGVGIPPENVTRIFNHGFTTRKDGHGFGLHSGALAAKQLGGELRCQSEGHGKGATFTLVVPVPPAQPLVQPEVTGASGVS